MPFEVVCNFYYDFLKLSQKLLCENIFLFCSTFINLLERSILNLEPNSSMEVLRVSSRNCYNFLCCYQFYLHFHATLFQSRNKLKVSVIFSTLFEKSEKWLLSHQMSCCENVIVPAVKRKLFSILNAIV